MLAWRIGENKAEEPEAKSVQEYSLRTPTEKDGLDRIVNGGLLRGKTYLVAVETGAGKTIFGLKTLSLASAPYTSGFSSF